MNEINVGLINFINSTTKIESVLKFFPYLKDCKNLKLLIKQYEDGKKVLLKSDYDINKTLVASITLNKKVFKDQLEKIPSEITTLNVFITDKYDIIDFKKIFIKFSNLINLILFVQSWANLDIFQTISKKHELESLTIYDFTNGTKLSAGIFSNLSLGIKVLNLPGFVFSKGQIKELSLNNLIRVLNLKDCTFENVKKMTDCLCFKNLRRLIIPEMFLNDKNITLEYLKDLEITTDKEFKLDPPKFPVLECLKIKYSNKNFEFVKALIRKCPKLKILDLEIFYFNEDFYKMLENTKIKFLKLDYKLKPKKKFEFPEMPKLKSLELKRFFVGPLMSDTLEELILKDCKYKKQEYIDKEKVLKFFFKGMKRLSIVQVCTKAKDSFYFCD